MININLNQLLKKPYFQYPCLVVITQFLINKMNSVFRERLLFGDVVLFYKNKKPKIKNKITKDKDFAFKMSKYEKNTNGIFFVIYILKNLNVSIIERLIKDRNPLFVFNENPDLFFLKTENLYLRHPRYDNWKNQYEMKETCHKLMSSEQIRDFACKNLKIYYDFFT